MTVEEPRARVVGLEPDGDIVAHVADTHDVAYHRIYKIVRRVSGAADYGKRVSMQVNRVLVKGSNAFQNGMTLCDWLPSTEHSLVHQ